ncbi:unnamed protein product [Rotaria magnacalcarata]|uniref:Protein sleepless n=1 Tax=Rotaria magnacalcarata TaxID=392030 RepID=A0A816H1Z6_9BILA|nr:unnamed protein product [Rotaria magnacalcarata]CAF2237857.1 unnamed protein product [Rotaria magnacalcarata]CAF3827103.1 unnamed protein product [Rotaria magnacalcarata]CAF5024449.1 unnamed protein product [Rotaria magnacalcarata]
MHLTLVVLLILIPSITTLKCYVCNSNDDPRCLNTNAEDLKVFGQECGISVDPYCRTITQTVNKDKSIVRACGSKITSKSCYKTAGLNSANVCSCNYDLCNSAPKFNQPQQIMTILSSIIVMATSLIMLR